MTTVKKKTRVSGTTGACAPSVTNKIAVALLQLRSVTGIGLHDSFLSFLLHSQHRDA
jgi:hypothetical protein